MWGAMVMFPLQNRLDAVAVNTDVPVGLRRYESIPRMSVRSFALKRCSNFLNLICL
jgi:hypothetical protein